METSAPDTTTEGVRRIVRLAAILNVAYFGVEFAVALAIGSVSLFADSIDFLEDTSYAVDNSKSDTALLAKLNGGIGEIKEQQKLALRFVLCSSN